jgi:hypothetical protein
MRTIQQNFVWYGAHPPLDAAPLRVRRSLARTSMPQAHRQKAGQIIRAVW